MPHLEQQGLMMMKARWKVIYESGKGVSSLFVDLLHPAAVVGYRTCMCMPVKGTEPYKYIMWHEDVKWRQLKKHVLYFES